MTERREDTRDVRMPTQVGPAVRMRMRRLGVMRRTFARVADPDAAVVDGMDAAKKATSVGTRRAPCTGEMSLDMSMTRGDGAVAKPERTTSSEVLPANGSPATPAVWRKVAVPFRNAAVVMIERNGDRVRVAQRAECEVAEFAADAICM